MIFVSLLTRLMPAQMNQFVKRNKKRERDGDVGRIYNMKGNVSQCLVFN